MKVSSSAYGLALWLTALADYAHHVGLERKMRGVVAKTCSGKVDNTKQIWQYSTNTIDLNEELLLRTSKWSHLDPATLAKEGANPSTKLHKNRSSAHFKQADNLIIEDVDEIDAHGDEYE